MKNTTSKLLIPTYKLRLIFLTIALSLLTLTSFSADIRPYISNDGSFRAVVIEGLIESDDFEKFIEIVRENQGALSQVYIFSSGGDFYEAMKIGKAMRALELASQVPMRGKSGKPVPSNFNPTPDDPKNNTCASAGFFIHIGAVHRGGTYLAVHRPYFDKTSFGQLSQEDAENAFNALQKDARKYMKEMGVPKHIQEDVLGTSSDNALVLDEKTVKTYFWLELPYRHEWILSKRSELSTEEQRRYAEYQQRLLDPRNVKNLSAVFTKAEQKDLQDLSRKKDIEDKHIIGVIKKSRMDAYERYFKQNY